MKRPVTFALFFLLFSCQKLAPQNLGLREEGGKKRFQTCPQNCLSSFKESGPSENFRDPIQVISTKERAKMKIKGILTKHFNSQILEEKGDYLRYELSRFLSPGIDLEFWFGEEKKVHFRVAPRGSFMAPSPSKIIAKIRFNYHQNNF